MTDGDSGDRRHAPRVKFRGITLVRVGERQLHCVAGNLSESGILIFPQQSLRVLSGRLLQVTFTLPGITKWINLHGMIVRQTLVRGRLAWGVEFDQVPQEVHQFLSEFIYQYQPDRRLAPPDPGIEIPKPVSAISSLRRKRGFLSGNKPALVVFQDPGGDDEQATAHLPASELKQHLGHSVEEAWGDIGEQIQEVTRKLSIEELVDHLDLDEEDPTVRTPRPEFLRKKDEDQ